MSGLLTSGQLTLNLTPQRVNGISVNPITLTVQNIDSTDIAYLGDQSVSMTKGIPLEKGETFTITLFQGNTLWAVSTKPTHQIAWIAQEL